MAIVPSTRREFLRRTAVAAAAFSFSAPGHAGAAEVPSTVPAPRLQRLQSGANVCRWFRFPRSETPEHFGNYIPQSEADWMAAIGLKHVRLCISPKYILEVSDGAVREEMARYVDAAIERFHRAGLLVMVDIHNEDRQDELNPAWQEAFIRFWGQYAARLARFSPDLTLLELVNEPVFQGREEDWNTLNQRLADIIRKAAPGHTLVTSGPNWGGIDGLQKLRPLEDPNVIYSFHCYDPFPFTHQGATWANEEVKPLRGVPYPSSPDAVAPFLPTLDSHPKSRALVEKYGREHWDAAKLESRFQSGIEWGRKYHSPLYCGEFGVYPPFAKPEHRANWFRDFGQVLSRNQMGWAVWGWDEGFGLNRKYSEGKPTIDPVVATALGLKSA